MRAPFAIWNIGDDSYKLKLSAGAVIAAEKELGRGLVASLENADSVNVQTIFLHAAMQKFNANTTRATVNDLYDDYMDLGGTIEDIMTLIREVLTVSGFLKEPKRIKALPATDNAQTD